MATSVANYCSLIWMYGAHLDQVETQVYKALRIVSFLNRLPILINQTFVDFHLENLTPSVI